MSTALYSVTSRNLEELSRGTDYRYEGNDREKYSNDTDTAYREEGDIWLPETFSDYVIMAPDEMILMMNKGAEFWQDRQTDDPEACLLYKIFQDN